MSVAGRLLGASLGAALARLLWSTAAHRVGAERWQRTNHRGETVTLLEGPVLAVASLVGLALTPGLPPRCRAAGLLAGSVAAGLGGYDDLRGSTTTKGLRGHLHALAGGEVTSGAVKMLGIGGAGLLAGGLARPGRLDDRLLAGVVVAGTANLLNLLDLRPGRAGKTFLLAAALALVVPGPAGALAAAPAGATVVLLPEDLGERAMLGDAGANTLGALLGVTAAVGLSRPALRNAAVAVVALTVASERLSFTEVIERTPPLRWLDRLGRRPVR